MLAELIVARIAAPRTKLRPRTRTPENPHTALSLRRPTLTANPSEREAVRYRPPEGRVSKATTVYMHMYMCMYVSMYRMWAARECAPALAWPIQPEDPSVSPRVSITRAAARRSARAVPVSAYQSYYIYHHLPSTEEGLEDNNRSKTPLTFVIVPKSRCC